MQPSGILRDLESRKKSHNVLMRESGGGRPMSNFRPDAKVLDRLTERVEHRETRR